MNDSKTTNNTTGIQDVAQVKIICTTPPSTPSISTNGSSSICIGQSVSLTANNICSGCSVVWSNGQTGTSIDVTQTGTYSATLKNACGTSIASNSIVVTNGAAPNSPTIKANGSTSLCDGQAVTLTISNLSCTNCNITWSNMVFSQMYCYEL